VLQRCRWQSCRSAVIRNSRSTVLLRPFATGAKHCVQAARRKLY
jgi:hypothetical protein